MTSKINHLITSLDERINRLDAIKGIIAICVVIGHTKKIPQIVLTLIFSFHVPCFFILSGYISSLKNSDTNFISFILKKTKRILIPYVFFFIIGYVYWLLTCQIESKRLVWLSKPWWDPLIGLIDNSGQSLYVSPGLWFLPCLFLTQTSHYILNMFFKKKFIIWLFFILTILSAIEPKHFQSIQPFSLHLFIASNLFYCLGHMIYSFKKKYQAIFDSFYVLILLTPIWFFLSLFNGQVDFNNARYGHFYGLSILNAVCGSLLVAILSRYVNWAIVARIGQQTLCILGFNFQLLSIISFFLSILSFHLNSFVSFITSIIVIAICSLLYNLLKKNTPRLIGEK